MIEKENSNDKKKEYLNKYLDCVRSVKRIEEQISELRYSIMCPSVKTSDMPTSSNNQKDLSDYIVKSDKLVSEMLKKRYERIAIYTDIFRRIENLDDEDERTVLTLRYIKGLKWEKIALEISVEWATVHRIHARALRHFEMPEEKEVSESDNLIQNDTLTCDTIIA